MASDNHLDFLITISGFGCAISSALTLVVSFLPGAALPCQSNLYLSQIFFPRSIEGEMADREATIQRKRLRSRGQTETLDDSRYHIRTDMTQQSGFTHPQPAYNYNNTMGASGTYLLTSSPIKKDFTALPGNHKVYVDDVEAGGGGGVQRSHSTDKDQRDWDESDDVWTELPPIRPNRRKGNDVQLGGFEPRLTDQNLGHHNLKPSSNVNPMVHNFTSPISACLVFSFYNLFSYAHTLGFYRSHV